MKSRLLMCFAAIALFAALAMPGQLAAQDKKDHNQHYRYQLIDMGTFGGPSSGTQDELKVLNSRGMLAGFAQTPTPDPNYPNSCFFCGPLIAHGFLWQKGVLTDLGALPGLNSSAAFGISDSGLSAGFSELSNVIDPILGVPEMHAVLWKNGQIIDLGTLEGGYESVAFFVNSRGQVAGISQNLVPDPFDPFGTQERTFLWQNGVMQDLGTLGGPDAGLLGFKGNVELNEGGQVVACSFTSYNPGPLGVPPVDPFLWDKKNGMIDLGSLGGTSGCAINLNNRGQVVGYSNLAGDLAYHPFFWDRGVLTDLGTFGGSAGYANSINDAGQVAGAANFPGDQLHDGFLWEKGVMTDLGNLGYTSVAAAINSKGHIVGASKIDNVTVHAFLWENGGPMIDLNTLIPPNSSLQLIQALAINDREDISGLGVPAGCGDVNACGHAYVLIPCEEGDGNCEEGNLTGAAQSVPAQLSQTPTTAITPAGLSGERMDAIRSRFGRRYPNRDFGTYQPK